MSKRRFVALDRDGTVVEEKFHLTNPDDLTLIPQAAEGMRRMRGMGLGLILITNQSVIGNGKLTETGLTLIHGILRKMLSKEDVTLDGIFYCPTLCKTNVIAGNPNPVF